MKRYPRLRTLAAHHEYKEDSYGDAVDGHPSKDTSEKEAGELGGELYHEEQSPRVWTQTAGGGLDIAAVDVWDERHCDIVEIEVWDELHS